MGEEWVSLSIRERGREAPVRDCYTRKTLKAKPNAQRTPNIQWLTAAPVSSSRRENGHREKKRIEINVKIGIRMGRANFQM